MWLLYSPWTPGGALYKLRNMQQCSSLCSGLHFSSIKHISSVLCSLNPRRTRVSTVSFNCLTMKELIILDELVLQLPEAPPDPQRSSSHGHSACLLWPAGTMPHQPAGLRGSDTQQTTKHFFIFFKSLMCNFTILNIFILTFTED